MPAPRIGGLELVVPTQSKLASNGRPLEVQPSFGHEIDEPEEPARIERVGSAEVSLVASPYGRPLDPVVSEQIRPVPTPSGRPGNTLDGRGRKSGKGVDVLLQLVVGRESRRLFPDRGREIGAGVDQTPFLRSDHQLLSVAGELLASGERLVLDPVPLGQQLGDEVHGLGASLEVSFHKPSLLGRFFLGQIGLGRDRLHPVGDVHRDRHLEDTCGDLALDTHAPREPDLQVPETVLDRHHSQIERPRIEQARHEPERSPLFLFLKVRHVAHGVELPAQSIDGSYERAGFGLDPEATADSVDIGFTRKNIQLNGLEPAPVREGQRKGIPALKAIDGVRPDRQRVYDPEINPVALFKGAFVVIACVQAEDEAIATRLEGVVEREVSQEIQITFAHGDRAARILGVCSKNLDDRVVVPVPEGTDGGLVPVEDSVLERGTKRRRDALLDESRVPDDRLVHGSPVSLGRFEQRARSWIDVCVRSDLPGQVLRRILPSRRFGS